MTRTLTEREQEFTSLWESVYDREGVVVFDSSLFPSYVLIDNLMLKTAHRRKGLGTEIMKDICEFADKWGLDVLLMPDEDFGTPMEVLVYFYGNFNFTIHDGQEYAGGWENYLLRKPTIKTQSIIFTEQTPKCKI